MSAIRVIRGQQIDGRAILVRAPDEQSARKAVQYKTPDTIKEIRKLNSRLWEAFVSAEKTQ